MKCGIIKEQGVQVLENGDDIQYESSYETEGEREFYDGCGQKAFEEGTNRA